MDSPCLSAGGLRFWDHPVPTEGLSLPCGRLTGAGQTSMGLPRFAPAEARWGWVPPVLRGRGARAGARTGAPATGGARSRAPQPDPALPSWLTILPATRLNGA